MLATGQPTGDQPSQQVVLRVERLHGGGRVVDARRQRLLADVDELPEAEGDVLLHGPVLREVEGPECRLLVQQSGVTDHVDQRSPRRDEVPERDA